MGLDSIDDNSQLAVGNDGYPGHVGSDGGAEVGLLADLLLFTLLSVSVGKHVLVDGLDTLVVILKSSFNLVLRVLDTPGEGVAHGALGCVHARALGHGGSWAHSREQGRGGQQVHGRGRHDGLAHGWELGQGRRVLGWRAGWTGASCQLAK